MINYVIDPNHQYWWKTSNVNQFSCFGFDHMDIIWFPTFKVFGIILSIAEIFFSQIFQKIPSEDMHNAMNELMHPNKTKNYEYTIRHFEDQGGLLQEDFVEGFLSFMSCPCFVVINNLKITCHYHKPVETNNCYILKRIAKEIVPKSVNTLVVIGRQAKTVDKLLHDDFQIFLFLNHGCLHIYE